MVDEHKSILNTFENLNLVTLSFLMEELFHYLDLKALRLIQEKAEAELFDSLLNGSSWQQVKEKRRVVTDVAIAIHKQTNSTGYPSSGQTLKKEITIQDKYEQ